MSQRKADEFRSLLAAARRAQTRWPDKTSERDLALDQADERSTGPIHPSQSRLLAGATEVAIGQATCVVLDGAHPGPEHILRGFRDRPTHEAMEATPALLALVLAANRTALFWRQFNHVRSPSTQAITNQHTRPRWLW